MRSGGGPKNNQSALYWYKEANKYDDAIATEEIEEIEQGREQQGLDRAFELMDSEDNKQYLLAIVILKRLAVTKNNLDAQLLIGRMYHEGKGVTRNDEKAMYWLKKVAEGHCKDFNQFSAFWLLGDIYKQGAGTSSDALRHYKQANELISYLEDDVDSSEIETLQNKIKKIERSLVKTEANLSSSTLNSGSSVDNDDPGNWPSKTSTDSNDPSNWISESVTDNDDPRNWPSESSDTELAHGTLITEKSEQTKEEIVNCASSTHSESSGHQSVASNDPTEDSSSSENASTMENENWTSKSSGEIDEDNFLTMPYQQQTLSKDEVELLHALSLLEEESYPQAIEILKKLAGQNNYAPAQLKLGQMYFNGDGVPEDDQNALFYFNAAAAGQNAEACFEIAEIFRMGIGVEPDMDIANKYYTKATELDKLVAKRIAEILQESDEEKLPGPTLETNPSVEQSESESTPDLEPEISDDPCESAATWLSIYTLSGIDKKIIRSILDDFAKNKIAAAFVKIGCLYADGNDIPQDYGEAIKWCNKALGAGLPEVAMLINTFQKNMLTLALADLDKQDYTSALQKLLFLVSEKNIEALYHLGLMHYHGHLVKKDGYQAMKCFRLAANEGNADACYQLGCCYHVGIGVKPSEHEAMVWYNLALKAGHPQAAEQIRILQLAPALNDLENKNYISAHDKFLILASEKNSAAQFQLGLMHLHGLGMKKDYDGAIKHFINAWENGYPQAAFMVAETYLAKAKTSLLGSLTEDFDRAFEWFQKASDEKNGGEASYQIATIFKGKIPESEIPAYLKKAHAQGHPAAIHDIFILSEKYRNKLFKNDEHLKLADELLAFAVSEKYPAAIAALEKQNSDKKKSAFF